MAEHHTKTKGDFAVFKVMVNLAEKGYMVLTPMTEHSPFDLVAYKDGKFKRVQVKFRKSRKGVVTVPFSQYWADKNGTHTAAVDKNELDYYAIYCPCTEQIYWLDPKKFNKTVTLRIYDGKQGYISTMNLAKDYLELI